MHTCIIIFSSLFFWPINIAVNSHFFAPKQFLGWLNNVLCKTTLSLLTHSFLTHILYWVYHFICLVVVFVCVFPPTKFDIIFFNNSLVFVLRKYNPHERMHFIQSTKHSFKSVTFTQMLSKDGICQWGSCTSLVLLSLC